MYTIFFLSLSVQVIVRMRPKNILGFDSDRLLLVSFAAVAQPFDYSSISLDDGGRLAMMQTSTVVFFVSTTVVVIVVATAAY